jgi:rhodanese-related sulfurtransferase
MKVGIRQLVDDAEKEIETLDATVAKDRHGSDDVVMVDLRDIRELYREGKIPGALHAPRGMLEFWVDPDSPYHKPAFAEDKTYIFYCQSGWRSALATQTVQRMGMEKVCHVGGGFKAWSEAGGPIEEVAKK